ncbi:hypothetical protein GGQ60_002932 [Pedobacter zeae]|uniref:Uncharacterized protein n=1 Tax=Pedobacter zeae TaxID=1737356 RepID=A0A7W6P6J3_9SPHI|nr:hypothetical protein [Pedobacter zeae]
MEEVKWKMERQDRGKRSGVQKFVPSDLVMNRNIEDIHISFINFHRNNPLFVITLSKFS